ncbi:hypothetical protein AB1K84_13465 [Mesobacillus foraminis]|uniref:hypothetical protein n=1 Tax=Mesobacillus foraminis TaxID=279826 RepID=UPI00399F2474
MGVLIQEGLSGYIVEVLLEQKSRFVEEGENKISSNNGGITKKDLEIKYELKSEAFSSISYSIKGAI